jgi:ferrous-iron efflux pump FieF
MKESEFHRSAEAISQRRAALASIAVALFLVGIKFYAWWSTDSVSLLGTLFDSALDAAASLTTLLAVSYSLVPPDEEHRFGHGKAQSLAALFQSVLITLSCVILLKEAITRMLTPQPLNDIDVGVGVMLLSTLVTFSLVAYQRRVIAATQSLAIRADSMHYSVDLGTNVAAIAALLLAALGVEGADPIFAIIIAVLLIYATRAILSEALDQLLDRELEPAAREEILRAARGHPDVVDIHGLRTRRSGPVAIVQLHLEIESSLTLREAHRIGDEVKLAVEQVLPDADVVIHLDPAGQAQSARWQD